ncbi:MAG TPA: TPM domain-containing protein [Nocardioidaceae bacterium]|nr:TPM domain-containing protein [Nocardioidaceae bacterium]
MPAGELLSPADRRAIQRAVDSAEALADCDFSVCIDESDGDPREYADRLHAGLSAPELSVLVLVDPVARQLEIVTGPLIRRHLDDSQVALAALGMQTSFAAGDFVGGITRGLQQLAEHARRPPTLHSDSR